MRSEQTPNNHLLDFESDDQEFQFIEVPIHFSPEKEQFPAAFIDIDVGTVKLSLPIDTGHGLGCILLSPTVLDKLDIQYTGRTRENYDAFGQRYESREYLLPNIRIGDLTIAHVNGFELFTRWGDPGFIGLPFLRHFNALIDYLNQRFGLYPQQSLPQFLASTGWTKVKLASPHAGLVLPLMFNDYDEAFLFCLDTGATNIDQGKHYNLINARPHLGKLLQQKEFIEPSTDAEVLGKLSTAQFRTASGFPLADLDFVLADLEYLKIDGLLGHNFFLQYSVFIDFSTEEIYLKPRNPL